MRREFPPASSNDASMGTLATFETLLAASAYAPAMRTVASTTTTTNAVIRRCRNAVGDRTLMSSFRGTADQPRARLRIDGNEAGVDGVVRDRCRCRRRGRREGLR